MESSRIDQLTKTSLKRINILGGVWRGVAMERSTAERLKRTLRQKFEKDVIEVLDECTSNSSETP